MVNFKFLRRITYDWAPLFLAGSLSMVLRGKGALHINKLLLKIVQACNDVSAARSDSSGTEISSCWTAD